MARSESSVEVDVVSQMISTARISLAATHYFWGVCALNLSLVERNWTKTAATDGKRLFYNRTFLSSLTWQQVLFVVAHEVVHVVYDHIGQLGDRDQDIWFMACDYWTNSHLARLKIGQTVNGILLDAKYTDSMRIVDIYDDLKRRNAPPKPCHDDHLSKNDDGSFSFDDGTPVAASSEDGPSRYTPQEMEDLRDEVLSRIVQSAEAAEQANQGGSVPEGVRRHILRLTTPKINWRNLIDSFIRSAMRQEYSYMKMSRRRSNQGFLFPGRKHSKKALIHIFIDASKSISEEMVNDAVSEIVGVCKTFPDFEVHIASFDTEVYNHKEIRPSNINDVYDYRVFGDGGTRFEAIFTWLRDNKIIPTRLVIFTDGLPNGSWGDENYCPTTFIIQGRPKITAPYGLTMHYESKS